MSKILAASLVAVVFSAALFIYSTLYTGPYGATAIATTPNGARPQEVSRQGSAIPVPPARAGTLRASGLVQPIRLTQPATTVSMPAQGHRYDLHDVVGLDVGSLNELQTFYDTINFDAHHWRDSNAGVPPVFVSEIPESWSNALDATSKKNLFFRAILPLILVVNEEVTTDRHLLLTYMEDRSVGRPSSPETLARLGGIAATYGVIEAPDKGKAFTPELSSADLKELFLRVDAVPVSMALGQAAYESGYATSRLATGENGLFGQWRDGDGLRPRGRRAAFSGNENTRYATPLASTRAYILNLNTDDAYLEFREERAVMRQADGRLDGYRLAEALGMYSDSGLTYANTLRAIIAENELTKVDDISLRDEVPVRVEIASN